MQIYGPTHIHGPQPLGAPHVYRGERAGVQPRAPDELSLSATALESERLIEAARLLPAIRQDRVDRLRAAIASGTYETEERLSKALDALLEELA
ncbi:MAG: flagellar biosynthesis anti-sigma factor FlgM [Pirellulales bacterium]|nr:flagellar biosynthesis anti-sigma factor FlgM [Pirellulales bacterium]